MKQSGGSPASPTRRRFIRGAGAGLALGGSGLLGAGVAAEPLPAQDIDWDRDTDVLVVGTGAAGFVAALVAHEAGARVLMLEKGPVPGGTTVRSGGVHFIPNNRFLRASGVDDAREDFLRLMVRVTYPEHYRPQAPRFGAPADEYALLEAFYDNAAPMVEQLEAMEVLEYMPFVAWDDEPFPDNYPELPENKAPRGRAIVCNPPQRVEGRFYYRNGGGLGGDLIERFRAATAARRIPILTRHAAEQLIVDDGGTVVGLRCRKRDQALNLRAERGVVFASGGFIHHPELRQRYLRGPVYGGCATPTNQGDFLGMAAGAGAALGNLNNGWWMEVLVEEALESSDTPSGVWIVPGDSSLAVNRSGRRFVNEKNQPSGRPQLHFVWDPVAGDWQNNITFMIWDQRVVRTHGGYMGVQPADAPLPRHVIEGATLDALADGIAARLEALAPRIGPHALDPDFKANLRETVARYNAFARAGKDEDFHRGESLADLGWNFYGGLEPVDSPYPNMTMHPLSEQGPYFATLVCAGAIDTKGGPRITPQGEVRRADGGVIPGLYAAGNCIASPTGGAYWGGGGTIGPAVVFGGIAGRSAAGRGTADA